MCKKLSCFLKKKIAIIQVIWRKIQKKSNFSILNSEEYQTLFWKWITLLRFFHSQERLKAHNLFKKWAFFTYFCQIFNFGSLMWSICVSRAIWHWGLGKYYLKSFQLKRFGHRIITRLGGSKKPFFVPTIDWWNEITTFMLKASTKWL